jgi:CheY-like chemotaxis protein
MLVSEVLTELGYAVLHATDADEALGVLRSAARVDVMVTDIGLPGGMNGRELADAGRAARPKLKVLLITGYAENAVLNDAHLVPGMQVVTKPFAMETLARQVQLLVSGE